MREKISPSTARKTVKDQINLLLGECGSYSSDADIKSITPDQATKLVDLASKYAAAKAMKKIAFAQQIGGGWDAETDKAVSDTKSLAYLNTALNNPDKHTRIPREREWGDALKTVVHEATPTTMNEYATLSALSQTIDGLLSLADRTPKKA